MIERNTEIVRLYLAGGTMPAIGERFNLSKQRVEQIIKESNITERRLWAKPKRPDKTTRFWAKVKKGGDAECWLWTGKITKQGYGALWWNKKYTHAHRIAWQLFHNQTTKYQLKHLCENRACCNPNHWKENAGSD